MAEILILGAGKSAYHTIEYLIEKSKVTSTFSVLVVDNDQTRIEELQYVFGKGYFRQADILNLSILPTLLKGVSVVISLLPARFHINIANECLNQGIHLVTPSYVSKEMQDLNEEVTKKGLIFLNELGLDPGIDHISALELIERIKSGGSKISSFKSWCGGLIDRESDTNPWHYKLSWNPYNVIRAGQDGAVYKSKKLLRYIPYHQLFEKTETVLGKGEESFGGYYNRNSIPYINLYGLEECPTFLRGTLRYEGFCSAWDFLVKTGLTSDKLRIPIPKDTNLKSYFSWFFNENISLIDNFSELTNKIPFNNQIEALEYLGINSLEIIPFDEATPAEVLEWILIDKWKLKDNDKDRVVMIHEIEYQNNNKNYRLTSILDLIGNDGKDTAMSKTVGLPLAIAAEMIFDGKISLTGVHIPIQKEIYLPMLEALHHNGIYFEESTKSILL